MRACIVAGTALILATVVLCDVTKVKTSEVADGSLPDHLVRSVEAAKAFLRKRKSTDAIAGDQKKRGWEFDDDEEEEEEEEEEEDWDVNGRYIGSRYRFRTHSRYPSRINLGRINLGRINSRYPNYGYKRRHGNRPNYRYRGRGRR
ncbi:uncharacterized protein LOC124140280 [Haliotis rufescens]|uniref:uncharacterized protein LOC124140280 n=1 Tax=Haliotis rufescens TaxID=6454 RepID=UPI001EB0939D|nr:uncharacterized protein LOC124140280 [Haliotis rufescens]